MDLSVILVFIVIFLLTVYFWGIISRDRTEPPGPIPWPIIGNVPSLAGSKPMYLKLMELGEKYGNIVQLKLGPKTKVVVVLGHKLVHELLVEKGHLTKFRPDVYILKRFSQGTGIFGSNGDHWQYLRKFTFVTLKDFGVGKKSLEERTKEEADIVCEELAKYSGKPIQLQTILPNATSNIISGIIFGSRFEYNDPDFNKLLNHLNYFFKNVSVQLPENIFPIIEKLPFSKTRKIFAKMEEIYTFIRTQIEKHRETYDPNCIRDIIDLYIEHTGKDAKHESEHITEKSLFYTIRDLYNAGSETTATSLMWLILYMTKYPEVQEKCQTELINAIGDRAVTMKDRENLPYFVAVIYEIQRIVNIAPIASVHTAMEDIEVGGKKISKNSIILPVLWSVHYDKNYWKNPEEFRPERFLDENGKPHKPEAFYPFSLGPRSCLGKQLAEMELFIFMSTLLQRFEFRHTDPGSIDLVGYQDGVTHMTSPYHVYAVERK